MKELLRLKATDHEDLLVLGACLQDALVLIDDMTYEAAEQRFILVANRFRWESTDLDRTEFERITTGVIFEHVTAVKRRHIDRRRGHSILSLLTVQAADGAIHLEFSEGACIRLEVSEILCHLQDVGESWPTRWLPHHPAADQLP